MNYKLNYVVCLDVFARRLKYYILSSFLVGTSASGRGGCHCRQRHARDWHARLAPRAQLLRLMLTNDGDDGKTHLLFTHRQIGEIIGQTKATAFCFLKKHAASLPEPVKASIPLLCEYLSN